MLLGDILARFDTPSFAEETVLALGDLNLRRVCARRQRLALPLCLLVSCTVTSWAAEGTTVAGPIGGTDIRSAFLPSPGTYGALITSAASAYQLRDGAGHPWAGLDAVGIYAKAAAAALLFVPNFKVFDGSIGFLGVAGAGSLCGQI